MLRRKTARTFCRKYQLRGLLVLTDDGKSDASDSEMHNRIESYIEWYKSKHGYNGKIEFDREQYNEPISTLNACIDTLRFYGALKHKCIIGF